MGVINVTRAYLPDKEKLFRYIDKIYESAWLTNNGQFCQELEARLKEHLGVRNLILVSNGTLALQVAYKALGLSGSAVTTPFSFVATASSLLWEGIKPIFADIDPETWNLDPKNIESAIQSDTTAIVPVHVFGNPCEVEEIDKIAKRRGLKIVYDGAHAFGVKYKGESVLNWGDAITLSFHATKLFHTIEGGAIITSDDDLAKKIRLLINFGISGPESIECVGINCKMNEFQAAMGLCVLDEMDLIEQTRRESWDYYKENIPSSFIGQKWNDLATQNFHYFPMLFKDQSEVIEKRMLLNKQDIFPRRYFYPSLANLNFLNPSLNMSNSSEISQRILCLPLYSGLEKHDQTRVVEIIRS